MVLVRKGFVPMTRTASSPAPSAHETRWPPTSAHAMSAEDVLARFVVDSERGLGAAEVEARLARFGTNRLVQEPGPSMWHRFLGQFLEPVIGILIVASVIAGLMGEWIDTLAILAIVLLNGVLGYLQEDRAERALAALQRLSAPMAKVLREGRLQSLPASELVPGDRIEVEAGDSVPADARLIRSFGLRVQEASLTGESVPVLKNANVVLDPGTPLGDRQNMVFMGTTAAAGKADAVVIATGMDTELGRIAGMLRRTRPRANAAAAAAQRAGQAPHRGGAEHRHPHLRAPSPPRRRPARVVHAGGESGGSRGARRVARGGDRRACHRSPAACAA